MNLYRKDYTAAKKWSDECITLAGGRLTNADKLCGTMARQLRNNETLFQLVFATNAENNGVNESLQTSYTTLTAPGNTTITGGFGDLVPAFPY